jgi:hypothetical protein
MEQRVVVAPVTAPARVAEMEVEDAPAGEAPEADRRVSYLTVRDLKVIAGSGRRSSDAPAEVSPLFNEVFGRKHAHSEPAESPAELVESSEAQEEQSAPHLEVVGVDESMFASFESPAIAEEPVVAAFESQHFVETTPSPDVAVAEHEPPPAAIDESVILEPATEPHTASVVSEPATEPHLATGVAETPAEAPAAAAAESEPGDAAAREEKRKRDLMMHAYRRRRSR